MSHESDNLHHKVSEKSYKQYFSRHWYDSADKIYFGNCAAGASSVPSVDSMGVEAVLTQASPS